MIATLYVEVICTITPRQWSDLDEMATFETIDTRKILPITY